MTFDVQSFDPHHASEKDLADYHGMRVAIVKADTAGEALPTYEGALGYLLAPALSEGSCRFWTAHAEGRLVGLVRMSLPEGVNCGNINVEAFVHPESRRVGIGTALLRAMLPAAVETQRVAIFGRPVKPESAGAFWADRLGFEVTHRTEIQILKVATTTARLWDVPVPAGYRVRCWAGETPQELIDSYAKARTAIEDAPQGRTNRRVTVWTVDQVRKTDRDLADSHVDQRVAVAVAEVSGEVVGVHVIHIYPHTKEFGYIQDTSVSAEHRGHGLGKAMKSAMMRRLVDELPELAGIYTSTASTNTHMIDINHALGYQTARTMIWIESTTARLASALALATPSTTPEATH